MPRILVVEDDTSMLELIVGTLRQDGYDVLAAQSGREASGILEGLALRDWSTRAVDLVGTDVRMAVSTA